MKIPIPIMSRLFRGISQADGSALMERFGASIRKIPKGAAVFYAGEKKRNLGVLLDGCLEMYETDSLGRRSIVGVVNPPESFAQVFAFAAVERHPASVKAIKDSTILVIPLAGILPRPGVQVDEIYSRFLVNLMSDICDKAWVLRVRSFILSRRTTAERLMTYLRQKMRATGSPVFDIPFDRQGLADFLCVDRSALSSVMAHLADEGQFTYRKNHFELKRMAADLDSDESLDE